MMIFLGNSSRWNASFELIACSAPWHSGMRGRAPVAINMVFAVTTLPLASVISCGPVISARSLKIVTSWLSSVLV